MKYSMWVEQREDSQTKGAGIFFTTGNKVLLLQRTGPPVPGCWSLPGGHLKEGEDALTGAKREAKEECGCDEGKMFAKTTREEDGFHFTTFFFEVEKPFDCLTDAEHSDFRWATFEELETIELLECFEKHIPKYLTIVKDYFSSSKKNEASCHE